MSFEKKYVQFLTKFVLVEDMCCFSTWQKKVQGPHFGHVCCMVCREKYSLCMYPYSTYSGGIEIVMTFQKETCRDNSTYMGGNWWGPIFTMPLKMALALKGVQRGTTCFGSLNPWHTLKWDKKNIAYFSITFILVE